MRDPKEKCQACKGTHVLRYRQRVEGPLATHKGGGWYEVPCILCVLRCYPTDGIIEAIKVVEHAENVKLSIRYPRVKAA